jgi:hypothetical protein
MTPQEQANYKRCFRKIKLGDHVRVYIQNGYPSLNKGDNVSSWLEVVALFMSRGFVEAINVESNDNYDFNLIDKVSHVARMRNQHNYIVSDTAGTHEFQQWLYYDAETGLISDIRKKAIKEITM